MSKVVGIHGQDVPAATAGEPREDVVVLAEWLAEAARSGEIIGIHAVFVFRDECTGTKRAGFQSYSVAGRMDALKTRILSDLDES